jgi:hypothetical protein
MITLDGTLGITTPSETNTGTLSVTGVTTLTGGLNAALPIITQATLAANVSGNGPTFRATKTSGGNQVIGANVFTKITYPDESWDTNSNYDTSTSRFTPTVAGYYSIIAACAMTSPAGTQFTLYRNGSFYAGSIGAEWQTLPTVVYLNGSTDYVEVFITNPTGTTVYANGDLSIFSGVLLRAG